MAEQYDGAKKHENAERQPPSTSNIIQRLNSLKNARWKLDNDMDLVRDARYNRIEAYIPDSYDMQLGTITVPTIDNEITTLAGNLTFNRPRIHIPPPTSGPRGNNKASHIERWLMDFFHASCRERGKDLYAKFADAQVELGAGIYKVTNAAHRWSLPTQDPDEDPEEYMARVAKRKHRRPLPIYFNVVSRRNFYYFTDDDGIKYAIECSPRTYDAICDDYSDDKDADMSNFSLASVGLEVSTYEYQNPTLTLVEYWDREWCVIMVTSGIYPDQFKADTSTDKEGMVKYRGKGKGDNAYYKSKCNQDNTYVIKCFRHGYKNPYYFDPDYDDSPGIVPYFIGNAIATNSDDVNEESRPVNIGLVDIALQNNNLLTAWLNNAILTAYPTIIKERNNQLGDSNIDISERGDVTLKEEEVFTVGKLFEAEPGTKYNTFNFGPLSNAVTAMVGEFKQIFQSLSMPSIMHGIPPGSRTAGYAIQSLADASKSKYNPLVYNHTQALANALAFTLWMVEHQIQQPVPIISSMTDTATNSPRTVGWRELSPADIGNYYNVECLFDATQPADRIQQGTFLANMVSAGLASRQRAMAEGLGMEQPEEELIQIMVEQELDNDTIRQYIRNQAFNQVGLSSFTDEANAAKDMFSQQIGAMNLAGMAMQQGEPPVLSGPTSPANGMAQFSPNLPAVTAPNAGGMTVPGAPSPPQTQLARGMATGGQQPRLYRNPPGAPKGNAQSQPHHKPISPYESR